MQSMRTLILILAAGAAAQLSARDVPTPDAEHVRVEVRATRTFCLQLPGARSLLWSGPTVFAPAGSIV